MIILLQSQCKALVNLMLCFKKSEMELDQDFAKETQEELMIMHMSLVFFTGEKTNTGEKKPTLVFFHR